MVIEDGEEEEYSSPDEEEEEYSSTDEEAKQKWVLQMHGDGLVREFEFKSDEDEQMEKIAARMGLRKLSGVTHLCITHGGFNCLPGSISSLRNVKHLQINNCRRFKYLPADLGDLESLISLSLNGCWELLSLPDSIGNLSNLTTLHLIRCFELQELPASLGDLHSLTSLSVEFCIRLKSLPNTIATLSNLTALHLTTCKSLTELPPDLGHLFQLMYLDIQGTRIKWLPRSIIKKLSNLQLLLLPTDFRLETLPKHLNDSLVISVEDSSVRNTWKELKSEIEPFSVPILEVAATQFLSMPRYLPCTGDPKTWIQSNPHYWMVRILDLNLNSRTKYLDSNIMNSISKLPQLTHLYVTSGYIRCLPLTFIGVTHLSFNSCTFECDINSSFDSLRSLSTLKSLKLLECRDLPTAMELPVSLTHLALRSREFEPLPQSYVANLRKLSNLNSLDLCDFSNLQLSPLNLSNLTKLKITNCKILSLPRGLHIRHLEIMHTTSPHNNCCHAYEIQVGLNQLVNLHTLSLTCHYIELHPWQVTLQNLQELQLKDCFNLRALPLGLDYLVKLRTLDVSGTKIKSLPDHITKLQNLQRVILPKCFTLENLPQDFKNVRVSIDDTHDLYYDHQGEYKKSYDFTEDDNITSGSLEGGDQLVSQESSENSTEGASPPRPLNTLPDATQLHTGSPQGESNQQGMYDGGLDSTNSENENRNSPCDSTNSGWNDKNPQGVDVKLKNTRKKDISKEIILQCRSKNMTIPETAEYIRAGISTVKRRIKEFEITWSENKKTKQCENAKNKEYNTESHCERNFPQLSLTDYSNSARHDHGMKHIAGTGSSSTFDVKATYDGETVRIDDFSLSSSIEQLKEEIGKKHELEVDKIKMKYLDTANEWIQLTTVSDLVHALHSLETLSGRRLVRLSIHSKT